VIRRPIIRYLFAVLALFGTMVQAELTIEITKGVEGAIPIAVVPFGGDSPEPTNMASIISADLNRSGRFHAYAEQNMPERPTTPAQIQFRTWQAAGQDNLAIGEVRADGPGRYVAQFYLYEVYQGSQLAGYRIPFSATDYRKTAHRISDIIYKQLTGEPGAFATRVAYVTVSGPPRQRQYKLQIADTDGYNPQTVVTSPQPVMSPAWSPDGKQIAYVSFEDRVSAVFVQTLTTGLRQKVSAAPGINGAPAWSPDGTQLALTLSKGVNPDIYILNLASGALRRITDHYAIDTEPTWSPDGQKIIFTSDRGGKPQLYAVSPNGGQAQRLTYEGEYNARGVFSPDGTKVAMVHGNGSNYRIAVLDLKTRALEVLTNGPLDESPGFAPNGSMILYASRGAGGAGQLAAVSIDGKVHQSLRTDSGEVREPAWSP
jgi:TolB protein